MEDFSPRVQRVAKLWEPLVGLAALLTIPLIFFGRDLDPLDALLANAIVWLVFTSEFIHVLFLCTDKRERHAWVRHSKIDILIILGSFPILPGSLQSIRFLRLGRAGRLLRFLRMGRIFSLAWIARWMGRRFRVSPLAFSASTALISIILGANALHIIEPDLVPNLERALWWAFTTSSTVGYGDIIPSTPAGRIVGVFLMIIGVASMAAFSGSLASFLVQHQQDEERADIAQILIELKAIRAKLDESDSPTIGGGL